MAAGADDDSTLAALLLDGPLAAAGLKEAVDQADRDRQAGRNAQAAHGYEQAASSLAREARPMAEVLLRRAAAEYERAGDHRHATDILRRLAQDALDRDAPHAASGALREAARIAGPEEAAEVEALFAWEEWTDDPDAAVTTLTATVRASD